jgi:hypothetical protein
VHYHFVKNYSTVHAWIAKQENKSCICSFFGAFWGFVLTWVLWDTLLTEFFSTVFNFLSLSSYSLKASYLSSYLCTICFILECNVEISLLCWSIVFWSYFIIYGSSLMISYLGCLASFFSRYSIILVLLFSSLSALNFYFSSCLTLCWYSFTLISSSL